MNRYAIYALPLFAAVGGLAVGYVSAPGTSTWIAPASPPAVETSVATINPSDNTVSSANARDPAADVGESIRAILNYPSSLHRQGALKRYLEQLPTAQFPTTLTSLLGQPGETAAVEMLFRVWADRAPEQGAAFVLQLPPGETRRRALGGFGRAWGRRDLGPAQKWAASASLIDREREELTHYLRGLAAAANTSPQRPLPEILKITDEKSRQRELIAHFRMRAANGVEEAVKEAATLPTKSDRDSVVGSLLVQWAETEPLDALRCAHGAGEHRGTAWHVFPKALEKNPTGTRAFVESLPPGPTHAEYAGRVAAHLLRENPDDAIRFYEEARARDPKLQVTLFYQTWFELDPKSAGPRFAEELAQRFPDLKIQPAEFLIRQAMAKWTAKDPQAAGEYVATLPQEVQPTAFYAVAEKWCMDDAAAALGWAAALPQAQAREEAVRQFTYTWSKHDTGQSSAWLSNLPHDPTRWAATEGFVFSVFDTDPDAALSWARSIADQSKSLDVLRRAWKSWAQKNEASASDWLSNAPLSEQERAAVERGE